MKKALLVLFAVVLFSPVFAQDKTISLTSLEWPPYTSASLAEQGASSAVAVAAFKAMGYTLKIDFYPWERAVNLAKTDSPYSGYFPEYWSDDNAKDFVYSDPMGVGPLGFVERKDAPVKWKTLDDLKGITIGTVSGYINTTQFDSMAASKVLTVEAVDDDATNIAKVANGRIPLAVIDPNVMRYLLKTDPSLAGYKDQVEFNAKVLEMKKLYVCFKPGAEGQRLSKIFDAGLKKIDVEKVMQDYFASVFSQ